MSELKEFNAKKGLEGFDATESRPMRTGKNALQIGAEVIFHETNELGRWGLDEKNQPIMWPMVKTDSNIMCNAPYVAGCMSVGEGVILNEDKDDPKFLCMHTPRSATDAGLKFDYVQNNLREDGSFPKLKTVDTLPVAIKRADLIANASEETKKVYQAEFGVPLDKLDVDYLPSYRKSKFSSGASTYQIKSSIVEITE